MKKHLPHFLLFVVLPIALVMVWWGAFTPAEIALVTSPAYHYAYMDVEGDNAQVGAKQNEVMFYLIQQKILRGEEITVLLNDPRVAKPKQVKARAGFVVADIAQVKPPLSAADIPARQVLQARIKAHPLFAYGRAYTALMDYAKTQDITFAMPTVETYHHSVLTVQMPLENSSKRRQP